MTSVLVLVEVGDSLVPSTGVHLMVVVGQFTSLAVVTGIVNLL